MRAQEVLLLASFPPQDQGLTPGQPP